MSSTRTPPFANRPATAASSAPNGGAGRMGEISAHARDQALIDTTARFTGAMYIYVTLWLVITLSTGLQRQSAALVWGGSVWLGLVAVARVLVGRQLAALLDFNARLAHGLTVGLAIANGLSWGLLTAIAVYRPELAAIRPSMLLVGVGLCSAGTVAMAINPTLKTWFPVSVIGPVALAVATCGDRSQGNLLLASMMVVYTIYVMQTARVVNQDYWRAQQAFRALEHASLTDPLTQVPNRLHFDQQYKREWRRARRAGSPLSVMIVDLDHFKHINDQHGHPAGDIVLREAARVMREALMRPCDLLARYGGEEFVVLLPDIGEDGARVVAERLRLKVAALTFDFESGKPAVTCSVGLASCTPVHSMDAAALVQRADAALYRAKADGRNRCAGWADTPPVADGTVAPATPHAR